MAEKSDIKKKATAKNSSPKKKVTTAKKATVAKKPAVVKKTTSTVKKEVKPKVSVSPKEKLEKLPKTVVVTSVKKVTTKRIEQEKKYTEEESWLYTFLLVAVVLLFMALKPFTFSYYGADITFSIVALPFVYFVSNYITKKFDYIESLKAIFASLVALIFYMVISEFLLGNELIFSEISGLALGYVMSQLINLTIYYYSLTYAEGHGLLIFMTFVFSVLIYNFVYVLFSFGNIMVDTFWMVFMISLILQVIIFIPLSFVDSQLKRKLQN